MHLLVSQTGKANYLLQQPPSNLNKKFQLESHIKEHPEFDHLYDKQRDTILISLNIKWNKRFTATELR